MGGSSEKKSQLLKGNLEFELPFIFSTLRKVVASHECKGCEFSFAP